MKKKPAKPERTKSRSATPQELLAGLEKAIAEVSGTGKSARALRAQLEGVAARISKAAETLDGTRTPATVFDPSNPRLIGRFIALALVAQDRLPIASVEKFYGAGIYAIYYNGSYPAYAPIRRSEHPIYVGKADPEEDDAKTPRDQGIKLWGRLNEHRKSITKPESLDVADFECRFLVVASGYQKAAEEYLINLFRPVWNSEVRLVYGIGKHGDAATTRVNKRSPWDTMHPGRGWAAATSADQKSVEVIEGALRKHFANAHPYRNRQDILSRFMADLHQLPVISSTSSEVAEKKAG